MALDWLFRPKSIALIGVSREKTHPGYLLLYSLLKIGFEGKLYPINPKTDAISGLKAFRRIEDIEDEVDLAIVAVRPSLVPDAIRSCGRRGVKGCIVVSSGFKESGGKEGSELEKEIRKVARENNVRLLGPNCMGIYSPAARLAFYPNQTAEAGPLGFIAQSGSLGVIFYTLCKERGVGFSKIISFGNECDLRFAEFLEYFGNDPETKIIASYLEGVENGREFFEVAKGISRKKPVIIWKAGLTKSGEKAALSHTGALAGSDLLWKAVFKQAGIIQAKGLEELLDIVLAFVRLKLPRGRHLAILSGPGGPAVAAADAAESCGLTLSFLDEATARNLCEIVPPFGTSISNPIDIGFGSVDPVFYKDATRLVAEDPNVDMIMVIGGSPIYRSKSLLRVEEFAEEMIEVSRLIEKPLVTVLPGGAFARKAFQRLYEAGIPVYPSVERAAKSLSALIDYKEGVLYGCH